MPRGQQVNVRLDAATVARLDALLEQMRSEHGTGVRVTRASVIVVALDVLERTYADGGGRLRRRYRSK